MFISRDGQPYFGDLQPGDRPATQTEIDAFNAGRDAANAASDAELSDRQATISDPFVQAIAAMTRTEVIAHIDATFSGLTVAQRNVLKAVALAARFAIRKG